MVMIMIMTIVEGKTKKKSKVIDDLYGYRAEKRYCLKIVLYILKQRWQIRCL